MYRGCPRPADSSRAAASASWAARMCSPELLGCPGASSTERPASLPSTWEHAAARFEPSSCITRSLMPFNMEVYLHERSLGLSNPIDRSLMCCGRRGSARVKGYENQKKARRRTSHPLSDSRPAPQSTVSESIASSAARGGRAKTAPIPTKPLRLRTVCLACGRCCQQSGL